jgi:hypothetical protein
MARLVAGASPAGGALLLQVHRGDVIGATVETGAQQVPVVAPPVDRSGTEQVDLGEQVRLRHAASPVGE